MRSRSRVQPWILTTFAVFGLFTSACGGGGGSGEPAAAPTSAEPPPPASASASNGSGKSGLEGPAAPTSSEDVKKGISALKAGDLDGAKAAFQAATQKNPKQADAFHYLGLVEDQQGHKAEAEKAYRRALELDPSLEESATNLAAILIEAGKNDDAANLMRKAIAKDPKSAALEVNLGMALSGKGDVDGANKAFEEAIRLEPNQPMHLVTYASHLARNGRKDDAAERLKQASSLAANDPGVLASIALEYKGMKDAKSCVGVLDKAIASKDVAELRIYRGACKLGLKDLPGATADFKDAVAKEPNNALAHYSLGDALADGGKLTEAISEWETCIKIAPDGPQAHRAQEKIARAKAKGGKK
jgi:Flp pilus assembly protein TadD